ncbi:hypothetical protein [Mesorhizobium onobrychidis]|uniref:DUF2251 domain-containing protein n=1 Tax=Mesorhizobium onobrychidis TaxID=2775404 RepID=A0ABY5QSL4_9HYPH|nr:hypothetical protein [Mesorhizobium onobrychidis]UVC14018.1 hypothetical protein IHQ72_25525 [Mesorhizobium onobrychidis]
MGAFDSAIRTTGDLAGVFEYDEVEDRLSATAYFYLVQIENGQAGLVINSMHIRSGAWAIDEADIAVKWDRDEQCVGLFIFGELWAAFDTATGKKYGGGYGKDIQPNIPWD